MILAPLCLTAILASIGFALTVRVRRPLLCAYLGFVTVAAVLGLVMVKAASPLAYRTAFWTVDLIHNALLCVLCLGIIRDLLHRYFVAFWGVFLLAILAIIYAKGLPASTTTSLLNISIYGDMIGGLLLVSLAFVPIAWPRGYAVLVAGVALILAGAAFPSIAWIQQGTASQVAVQWSTLPGLALLAISGGLIQKTESVRHGTEKSIAAS